MKSPPPSSDPLPNARHEAFAREIALGRKATQAYANVYGVENRRVASTAGHRLLRTKSVAARIEVFQEAGADGVAMDLHEIHDFLTRVKRTPAGELVASSDLCARVKHTRDGGTEVWMPNKLACIRLSAKLQGFLSKPAEPRQSPCPEPQDRPILTEEQREILMAKRAAYLEELHQTNGQQPAEGNCRGEARYPGEATDRDEAIKSDEVTNRPRPPE
jgi:hypothetical protein